jgi:hypothetical protein
MESTASAAIFVNEKIAVVARSGADAITLFVPDRLLRAG